MNRRVLSVLVCLLVGMALLASSALGCAAEPTEKIVMKAISCEPVDSLWVVQYQRLINMVNERAKGELYIDFLGGPEVIDLFEQPEAVRAGTVDMCFNYTAIYKEIVPAAIVTHLSTLTPSQEREPGGYYDFMVERHKEGGLFYLGRCVSQSPFYMYLIKPVETPQELARLKCRSAYLYDPFIKALGMVGFTTKTSEAYGALEKGIVDACIISLNQCYAYKWYEVAKYTIDHPFWEANHVIILNLDKWNSLPKHLQDLIIETQIECEQWGWDYYADKREVARQQLIDQGMNFIKFSPSDAQWFTDLAYSCAWEEMEEVTPEYASTLRKMLARR